MEVKHSDDKVEEEPEKRYRFIYDEETEEQQNDGGGNCGLPGGLGVDDGLAGEGGEVFSV